ncbi:MAG: HD domain-containing protein [Bacteroidales bacterium]|nr:HD domain-containing protein [Bacteroidales bacterium]
MARGTNKLKILNDPVHGFIKIPSEFIYDLLEDPWFQRLRFIKQLGLTDMVYPGATHNRFLHSLGALHLMGQALNTLRKKKAEISDDEFEAALVAILCHDLGHGPFSHSLEFNISGKISHEDISLLVMKILNEKFAGKMDMAIQIFSGTYHKKFFGDLISSQLDMDRLDYLLRDSFYTGVIEGSVGSDRIISMLNTSGNRLVVEEKGVYSIEKFLIARRFMYWQVYMHKTVLAADQMLKKILGRARFLIENGETVRSTVPVDYFIRSRLDSEEILKLQNREFAKMFFKLDDNEIISSIRQWAGNGDTILSDLSKSFLYRRLPAIELSDQPFPEASINNVKSALKGSDDFRSQDAESYIFSGCISNLTYAPAAPSIKILKKDGSLRELTELSSILRHEALSKSNTRYYLCYPKDLKDSLPEQ